MKLIEEGYSEDEIDLMISNEARQEQRQKKQRKQERKTWRKPQREDE